jgi:hypothetical protein
VVEDGRHNNVRMGAADQIFCRQFRDCDVLLHEFGGHALDERVPVCFGDTKVLVVYCENVSAGGEIDMGWKGFVCWI